MTLHIIKLAKSKRAAQHLLRCLPDRYHERRLGVICANFFTQFRRSKQRDFDREIEWKFGRLLILHPWCFCSHTKSQNVIGYLVQMQSLPQHDTGDWEPRLTVWFHLGYYSFYCVISHYRCWRVNVGVSRPLVYTSLTSMLANVIVDQNAFRVCLKPRRFEKFLDKIPRRISDGKGRLECKMFCTVL